MAVSMFVTGDYTEELRLQAIRDLSGNIKIQTKSDAVIIEIASRKDQIVFELTNTISTDWGDLIPNTALVIDASNCYTAAEILRSFGTAQNDLLATELTEKADTTIQSINGNSTIQQTPDILTTQGFNADNEGTFN